MKSGGKYLFDMFQVSEPSESKLVCKICSHTKTQVLVCGTCLGRREDKIKERENELLEEIRLLEEEVRSLKQVIKYQKELDKRR